MTLPIRIVSLLLIYCFVCSLSAGVRVPTSVGISTRTNNPTKVGTLTPLDHAYDLLSSLFSSRQPNSSDDEDADKEDEGLKFRLSEASEQPEAKATNKIAQTSVLSDAETQAILNRLPLIKSDATDEVEFALRDRSLPPPRTGAIIMQPFPAALETAPPDQKLSGPLEVVRQSPEGDVPIAPNLSVTFSQPMVAVTSQEEAAESVPVKLLPQPPGKWHWIGTRTLLFEPDVRFPMATQYSVTVPAGTKSANGGVLGQAKSWTFTTPPPTVKNFYPAKAGVQRRDVLIFAEFDQRIDPKAVLGNLKVIARTAQVATRLGTKDEIEADENVKDLVKNAEKDRWLAFRAIDANGSTTNALPAGANVNVTILAGTPSAEGGRTTKEPQNFPFTTFSPLRLVPSGQAATEELTTALQQITDLAEHSSRFLYDLKDNLLPYMDRAWQDARAHGWSREPVVEVLIPSTLDDTLAPEGQHVASLFCQHVAPQLPDGKSWDDYREEVADLMIATVDKYAPGFGTSVIGRQMLSPLDLERQFGLLGGDIFHGALTLNQLFSARPMLGHADYRGPLKGLYHCGSGAHPGGGVTGAPGHNAARVILGDHRALFG